MFCRRNSPNLRRNAPANTPDEELEASPLLSANSARNETSCARRRSRVSCASSSRSSEASGRDTWTSLKTPPPYSVRSPTTDPGGGCGTEPRQVAGLPPGPDRRPARCDQQYRPHNAATVRQAGRAARAGTAGRKGDHRLGALARQRPAGAVGIIRSLEVSGREQPAQPADRQREAALAQRKADSTKGQDRLRGGGLRTDQGRPGDGGRDLSNRLSAAVDKGQCGHRPAGSRQGTPGGCRRPWLPITTRRSMRRLRATAGISPCSTGCARISCWPNSSFRRQRGARWRALCADGDRNEAGHMGLALPAAIATRP